MPPFTPPSRHRQTFNISANQPSTTPASSNARTQSQPSSALKSNLKSQHRPSGTFTNMPRLTPQPTTDSFVPQSRNRTISSMPNTPSRYAALQLKKEKESKESWNSCMELSLRATALRTGSRAQSLADAVTFIEQEETVKREKRETLERLLDIMEELKDKSQDQYVKLPFSDEQGREVQRSVLDLVDGALRIARDLVEEELHMDG